MNESKKKISANDEDTKEKKIEQKPNKMRLKPLSALAALSLVLLLASSSLSTTALASSDGPSVDPSLEWLTPQEFKVCYFFSFSRRDFLSFFLSPSSSPPSSTSSSSSRLFLSEFLCF